MHWGAQGPISAVPYPSEQHYERTATSQYAQNQPLSRQLPNKWSFEETEANPNV